MLDNKKTVYNEISKISRKNLNLTPKSRVNFHETVY